MAGLFYPPIDDQIACLEREIEMRHHVYKRRVAQKLMTQAKADREIEVMTAALDTLRRWKEKESMP